MSTQAAALTTFDWNTRNVNGVEQIDEWATLTWLHDGKIVCFTINSVERQTVDAWLKRSYEIVQAWPADVPYLAIQDVTNATLTPYIREKSAATVALTPKYLRGRSAVVMSPSVKNHLIRLFVTATLTRQNASIQRNVFLKKSQAVDWLLQFKK